jgi:signal transduction histidine kinase
MEKSRIWRLSGPPLALQIMVLSLGGLVVAQLVTLLLTLVLPPQPQPQYGLGDIARALSGLKVSTAGERPLQRVVQAGPPQLTGPGWLTSDSSRRDLAVLLKRDEGDVMLAFFTPLPFAGTAQPPRRAVVIAPPERQADARDAPPREDTDVRGLEDGGPPAGFIRADYKVAQATPAANGFPGGFPGGYPAGPPPGGFPGGFPGGVPMHGGMIGGAPQGLPQGVPQGAPGVISRVPGAPVTAPSVPQGAMIPRTIVPQSPVIAPDITAATAMPPPPVAPPPAPDRPPEEAPRKLVPHLPQAVVTAPAPRMVAPPSLPDIAPPAPAPQVARPLPPMPQTRPVPLAAPPRGLFGLAPAPFVEGDFIAALKLADGSWAVVQPMPEAFPNDWQRRVLLWFVISFALVAPLGWIFAQRLTRPLTGFAMAAERLGRDPGAAVLALEGPAEVGRAAHAFNRMQSRLKSFVDDRTAFVGAISHDLRTPLTRLRFRIEDVPDEMREGMLAEVDEMERMISSVLNFIRDASEPGSREKLDLKSILEDVVEDAVFIGKDVTVSQSEQAPVEVDALGMRRVLGNLVENAVKYGDRAVVRLFTDEQDAVAEISDNGPGLPDDELERVFQPFYRAPAARASAKHGTGLGLAVCRSIARAHGGDVKLARGKYGLVAQLRLPLAYGALV